MNRLFACFIVLAAAPAAAQERPLEETLKIGVPCAWGDPMRVMTANAERSGADANALVVALARISTDPYTCEQVQRAAGSVSSMVTEEQARKSASASQAARDHLAGILREADQQASTLQFEVGPPPRYLTRKGQGGR